MFSQLFSYIAFSRKTCCHVAELRGCHSASHTCAAFGSDNRCKYTKSKQFWPQWLGDESREWGVHDHQEWESPSLNQHRAWKWMVGILVSFWMAYFSGAMLVLGSVRVCLRFMNGPLISPTGQPSWFFPDVTFSNIFVTKKRGGLWVKFQTKTSQLKFQISEASTTIIPWVVPPPSSWKPKVSPKHVMVLVVTTGRGTTQGRIRSNLT